MWYCLVKMELLNKKRRISVNKIEGMSLDLTNSNIEKIKELFPNIVTDGKIDFDMLKTILGDNVEDNKEKYQFTWHGKSEAIKLAQSPSSATLRPDKESSKKWDSTENLYIEGDNLEVLKQLQKTYCGKIKMIYIDPPYNTGSDFVYHDDFKKNVENYKEQTNQTNKSNPVTSGRYHTDWLNMMYPRLLLARNLLAKNGVIFISIDDNEIENLKKICCEIFGEYNFIGCFSVENNPKGRKNSKFISVSSEYCLCFAKNINESYFIENVPKNASDMTLDENGRYVHNSGKRVLVGENSFNNVVEKTDSEKNYVVYYHPELNKLVLKKEMINEIDATLTNGGYVRYCSKRNGKLIENTYTASKLLSLFENKALQFGKDKIYEKNYSDTIRIKSQLINKKYEAIVHGEKKEYSMELRTTDANTYLKQLFGLSSCPFEASKSIGFLRLLITLFEEKDFIALDFFSGSSSLSDAIMRVNTEDGGNRKFIMVQLPELCDEKSVAYRAGYKNICEIGKERIRRAGELIKSEWEKKYPSDGLFSHDNKFTTDIGFKVFKLDSTNIKIWDNENELNEKTIFDYGDVFKEDRNKADILYEILLKYGVFDKQVNEIEINGNIMYRVGKRFMIVCLNDEIKLNDVTAIAELFPKTVVFKESGFKNDNDKINAEYNLLKAGVEDVKCI